MVTVSVNVFLRIDPLGGVTMNLKDGQSRKVPPSWLIGPRRPDVIVHEPRLELSINRPMTVRRASLSLSGFEGGLRGSWRVMTLARSNVKHPPQDFG